MPYDHRSKAGNQGDVVKHVALLAVARHMLAHTPRALKYVDAFAGPAGSLLIPGGEWNNGIGKLNRAAEPISPDVACWMRWYLARPQLVGLRYPGSALIVADAAARLRKKVEMTLWDISAEAVADLRMVFPKQRVVHAPVDPTDDAVRSANFLFVDPPGLNEQWPLVLELLGCGQHMLAWLPVNTAVTKGSAKISAPAETQLQTVRLLPATFATRVLWAHGGRTMGCLLVYRSTSEAVASIRAAVTEVLGLCSWSRKDIEHFDPPV